MERLDYDQLFRWFVEIHKMRVQNLESSSSKSLQSQMAPHPKNRLQLSRLEACSWTTAPCSRPKSKIAVQPIEKWLCSTGDLR